MSVPNAHWAVCRVFSSRVHIVRTEIEKTDRGTFLPTYAKVWVADGKLCVKERALMPGYLFFKTEPASWSEVKNVYGVFDVLNNNGQASRVTDAEMQLLVMGHVTGEHNDVSLEGLDRLRPDRKRRRRARPSKRARAA